MLVCSNCAAAFPVTEPRWRCDCGAYLLPLNSGLAREALRDRPPSLWRYREALGIQDSSNIVTMGEGFTPLMTTRMYGGRVALKLDYLCPTGSYKDRGSAVMISKLKEWGVRTIVEDSSGNAGASIAAYAALAGIRAEIYIPESTSAGKAAQIGMYGANLVKVPGSREDAAMAAWEAAHRIFYASHNWSPYFLTGMKTAAYEIAEQLSWETPDCIITPAGGGGLLVGLYLGFIDLLTAGITRAVPRLAAVQSANCDPIYRSWPAGLDDVPAVEKRPPSAEGISVAKPVRGPSILRAIRDSGGVVTTVTGEAIWDTVEELGRQGVYVEPTAAAAPAALGSLRKNGFIGEDDRVVIVLTGSGLKATDKIVEHLASRVSVRLKKEGNFDVRARIGRH
jgi:threonine synthase